VTARRHAFGAALRAALFAIVLGAAGTAAAQTCTFNANQPTTAGFGAINPAGVTPATFTITVNYKCTGNATATFTITGANDSGPGAYRLRNTGNPTQYMAYTIATTNVPGTKITLDGTIVAASYQNAYVGNYADTLTVLVLP
jgi:spore coat protein U-like protein